MAVTDFFLNGTIAANTTVTIQPASGTIYSFKRGLIATDNSNSAGTFSMRQIPLNNWIGYGLNNSGTAYFPELFWLFSFSETGVSFYATSGGIGVFSSTAANQSHPFVAISNSNTVSIITTSSATNGRYTLVGVSMT